VDQDRKEAAMLLGQQLGTYAPSDHGNHWDTTLAAAQACEQAGLDSVWLPDHFMFPDRAQPEKEVPVFDCFVALGAIAASTSRIRLGELVVGVPYRNPALLAKMCATLDVISHGRSIVGLGAAWHEGEFAAYGWPFPPARERLEMLEEAVQVVDRMLTQRPASFSGKHYSIQDAYNDPRPVQQPRPPIMIGGSGEQVTLKLVARYADICNVGGDPATVARKFEVLRGHCEAVGRPFSEITLCNNVGIVLGRDEAEVAAKMEKYPGFGDIRGTPETVVARLQEYAQVGSRYVTFHMPDAEEIDPILLLGEEVLPPLAGM
jgi:F420-dependent oxidoreductase-like protein